MDYKSIRKSFLYLQTAVIVPLITANVAPAAKPIHINTEDGKEVYVQTRSGEGVSGITSGVTNFLEKIPDAFDFVLYAMATVFGVIALGKFHEHHENRFEQGIKAGCISLLIACVLAVFPLIQDILQEVAGSPADFTPNMEVQSTKFGVKNNQ